MCRFDPIASIIHNHGGTLPTLWKITLEILRQRQNQPPYVESFELEVDPDENVLDCIERVWAFHDRSLTFRHACHHSTCGACGMRVNGVEKLTCITPVREVTHPNGVLRIEPLRNFPVLSDLVVDVSGFFQRMEQTQLSSIAPLSQAKLPFEPNPPTIWQGQRLIDCIECGLCVSACPAANTSTSYFGPAVLAAAQHVYRQTNNPTVMQLVNCADGLWRCHSAYECSAVCPSNVDPAWRIMDMRRATVAHSLRNIFKRPNQKVAP